MHSQDAARRGKTKRQLMSKSPIKKQNIKAPYMTEATRNSYIQKLVNFPTRLS